MKKLLLLLFISVTFLGFSQTPITNYNSALLSNYAVVDESSPVDQSSSGANATWDFNGLISTGASSTDNYLGPNNQEQIDYPGTTIVLTNTNTSSSDEIIVYSKDETGTGVFSITGISAFGLDLNYVTDNALIGSFPLSYPYTNTDNVAGTFNYSGIVGGFTGTITAEVDGYGSLMMNDLGVGAFNGNVTRLKTVENIFLDNGGGITGNATLTAYRYYDVSNGNLVFRTNTIHLLVPFFSVDTTTTTIESLLSSALGVTNNKISEDTLRISPNPVNDNLNFYLSNKAVISWIVISDVSGRQILKVNTNVRTFPVNQLNTGIYIMSVITDKGVLSRRFIKE